MNHADAIGRLAVLRFARSPWGRGLQFLLIASLLQWGWSCARGGILERAVIHGATVHTSVALINLLTPSVDAMGDESRIKTFGGGINILNGCEGTEVFFLLVAATLVAPLPTTVRVIGIVGGALLVFVLNQFRLLGLFYTRLYEVGWFEAVHGVLGPALLMLFTIAFFVVLLRVDIARE